MIIACPLDGPMQFYDADTLSPLKERNPQELDGSVMQMSFHPETDTYIMGTPQGYIYTYNASNNELKKLKRCDSQVPAATFVSSISYVYSEIQSKRIFLGTLGSENVVSSGPQENDIFFLQHLPKQNLLAAGSADGFLTIYRTDKCSRLPVFGSVRAHLPRMFMTTVQKIVLNRKEYVVTASQDKTVKIWHLVKGRVRLIKVIQCEEMSSSLVYLENYKMIAITSGTESIQFLKLPSGKLENVAVSALSEDMTHSLFFMKEKNMIGVTTLDSNKVELIQLGGSLQGDKKKN